MQQLCPHILPAVANRPTFHCLQVPDGPAPGRQHEYGNASCVFSTQAATRLQPKEVVCLLQATLQVGQQRHQQQ